MKNLFELGNQYARKSSWKDFALVKLCLCAMGTGIGVQIPQKHRKAVFRIAACVFIATYIPLMARLLKIALRKNDD